MLSIKDFTNIELLEQISNAQEDMDNLEYGTADYNAALSELTVAQAELNKRNKNQRRN